MRNMGLLNDGELIYVAGFVSPAALCEAVMDEYIRVDHLRKLASEMERAFGGYDGVVDFCGIYTDFGKDKAKLFLEDFTDNDKTGWHHVSGFDSPEDRESWLADREAHWENY